MTVCTRAAPPIVGERRCCKAGWWCSARRCMRRSPAVTTVRCSPSQGTTVAQRSARMSSWLADPAAYAARLSRSRQYPSARQPCHRQRAVRRPVSASKLFGARPHPGWFFARHSATMGDVARPHSGALLSEVRPHRRDKPAAQQAGRRSSRDEFAAGVRTRWHWLCEFDELTARIWRFAIEAPTYAACPRSSLM